MATERELVELPSGISLEAKLRSPEIHRKEGNAGLAVLLHPWSWLGGRMEDQCEPSLIASPSKTRRTDPRLRIDTQSPHVSL